MDNDLHERISCLRRDLHAHPELAFGEFRTSDTLALRLSKLGLDVQRGIAGTGIVAKLTFGSGRRAVGLRADMDALPLDELNRFEHRSVNSGVMHACGHDGHMAMLVGAAEALVAQRRTSTASLDGTVYFIFQPAEEHEGGGRAMVEQGLFERFPMQAVFGLHNWPGLPAGTLAVMPGPIMAGADRFDITVRGRGGHAGMPHQAADTVIAGAALVQALQTLVSRNTHPLEPAVLSVTRFQAGRADNILPETAVLGGTVRSFTKEQQTLMESGMRRICDGVAATYDVAVSLSFDHGYPPTVNTPTETEICRKAAALALGEDKVLSDVKPSMGSEDFAYMLLEVPGCYVWLGNDATSESFASGCSLHSPHYDFNDAVIPFGVAYWVSLVESMLKT